MPDTTFTAHGAASIGLQPTIVTSDKELARETARDACWDELEDVLGEETLKAILDADVHIEITIDSVVREETIPQ